MQIREIVLYGKNGKVRKITFNLGRVNIITGREKTGKSSVGKIIDYCMGGDSCDIPEGKVRKYVAWYGVLFQLENERLFVARKNPESGQQSNSHCFVLEGETLEAPSSLDFESNTNVKGLERILEDKIGISENLHVPEKGATRAPLSAGIRHAIIYCFQEQDEIASNSFLFHNQSKDYVAQAIRDTLPYLLGVVQENEIVLKDTRTNLKRELKSLQQKQKENDLIVGVGISRAKELVEEARQVGLISSKTQIDYDDLDSMKNALKTVLKWDPQDLTTHEEMGVDRLTILQEQLYQAKNELAQLQERLRDAKRYSQETEGYDEEMGYQKRRLESICLFEKLNFNANKCPFCSTDLKEPLPSIEKMKDAIRELDRNIGNIGKMRPKISGYINDLEGNCIEKKNEIETIKNSIDAIYKQRQDEKVLRDLNVRKSKVLGRISLWLESNEDSDNKDFGDELVQIKTKIEELDRIIDDDNVMERLNSVLSIIQMKMTQWATDLQLEYSGRPYRIDLRKTTVVVDTAERPIPLTQLGSGSNWLGVHLIAYFALQDYFIQQDRPVPRFLFLDQPSQVWYPSEKDIENVDSEKVKSVYRFIKNGPKNLRESCK